MVWVTVSVSASITETDPEARLATRTEGPKFRGPGGVTVGVGEGCVGDGTVGCAVGVALGSVVGALADWLMGVGSPSLSHPSEVKMR